jgi:hypothetical protein
MRRGGAGRESVRGRRRGGRESAPHCGWNRYVHSLQGPRGGRRGSRSSPFLEDALNLPVDPLADSALRVVRGECGVGMGNGEMG